MPDVGGGRLTTGTFAPASAVTGGADAASLAVAVAWAAKDAVAVGFAIAESAVAWVAGWLDAVTVAAVGAAGSGPPRQRARRPVIRIQAVTAARATKPASSDQRLVRAAKVSGLERRVTAVLCRVLLSLVALGGVSSPEQSSAPRTGKPVSESAPLSMVCPAS